MVGFSPQLNCKGASSRSPRNHFSSPRFAGKPEIPSSLERDSKFQVSASPPFWCSRHSSWAKTFYFEDIFPNLDPTCSSVLHQQTAFHIKLTCQETLYLQIRFGQKLKRTNLTFLCIFKCFFKDIFPN